MGDLTAAKLTPAEPIYDPKKNFDQVRHGFGWVPWEPVIAGIDHLGAPSVIARPADKPVGSR